MDLSRPVRLRPGFVAVRRDDRTVQVGIDAPHRVILSDGHTERELLARLNSASGVVPGPADLPVLALLDEAGLLEPVRGGRELGRLAIDASGEVRRALTGILAGAGLGTDPAAPVVLVADDGEITRDRVDPLMRSGRAHLTVAADGRRWTVGPFVVPGTTACLRCVDAHRTETDPRRLVVAEQLARHPRARSHDPLLRDLALAWALRDLRTYLSGGRPATWSASYVLGDGTPEEHRWRRHPHCGCAWDRL